LSSQPPRIQRELGETSRKVMVLIFSLESRFSSCRLRLSSLIAAKRPSVEQTSLPLLHFPIGYNG
jgi:hypothetical protein